MSHEAASAYLFPSFKYLPQIPTSPMAVEAFIKGFILPSKLHGAHDVLSPEQRTVLLRDESLQEKINGIRDVDEIVVQICGHGGRDERCGILGPLLRSEFEEKLHAQGYSILDDADSREDPDAQAARVGLISHIGGHKFAGNVIIYIPPSMGGHALAGKGIWYGRVGPEHVEGLVKETIIEGRVVKDMFRGGIGRDGEMLRI